MADSDQQTPELPMSRNASWRAVVEAYQTVTQKYARVMNHVDLTPSQFDVLVGIEQLGDKASPKAVAEGLLVTMGNITSVTRRLIERGLVEQVANPADKRSIYLRLSKDGTELLQQAKLASKRFVEVQLAPFSEQEIEVVGRMMQRMRLHMESEGFQSSLDHIVADLSK